MISNSFDDFQSMTPGSPFYEAYWQLFVDAALRNQTAFTALGDGGSGNETGNGLTNVIQASPAPTGLLVGGTSLSTLATAAERPDVDLFHRPARPGGQSRDDLATRGRRADQPADDAAALQTFVETAWNTYFVDGTTISDSPTTSSAATCRTRRASGGVDATQPTPSYQIAYGSTRRRPIPGGSRPRRARCVGQCRRQSLVPRSDGDMLGDHGQIGTSAATPLWASLAPQLNAIFDDQGLPQLGYMNDLLYIASAIAPASFNDVTLGNNISSFVIGGA